MKNPELWKNIRLELNLTKLGVSFGLVLLIAYIVYQKVQNSFSYAMPNSNPAHKFGEEYFDTFSAVGFFFVIVWGCYLAANSISEEMRQRTWDFVRMSSLSPLKILTGKMFGSTALVWIIGLTTILPIMLVSSLMMIPDTQTIRPEIITAGILTLCLILWALLFHSGSILFALHSMIDSHGREKMSTIGITLFMLIAGVFTGGAITQSFKYFHEEYRLEQKAENIIRASMQWYDLHLYRLDMMAICLAFATFWSLIASYRLLRANLHFRDLPTMWIGFLITTSIFVQGFATEHQFSTLLYWPIVLGTATMGGMVIFEAHNIVQYKTFAARLCAKAYKEAFTYMPLWMISFTFLLIALAVNVTLYNPEMPTLLCIASLLCLMIRDLLMMHYLAWKPGAKRLILTYLIYGGLIYFLLPLLFKSSLKAAMMFFPLPPSRFALDGLVPDGWIFYYFAFQIACIAGAGWLFSRRWKSAFKVNATLPAPAVPNTAS